MLPLQFPKKKKKILSCLFHASGGCGGPGASLGVDACLQPASRHVASPCVSGSSHSLPVRTQSLDLSPSHAIQAYLIITSLYLQRPNFQIRPIYRNQGLDLDISFGDTLLNPLWMDQKENEEAGSRAKVTQCIDFLARSHSLQ